MILLGQILDNIAIIINLNYLQSYSIADVVLATRYKWKYPIKGRIQKALLL